MINVGVLTGTRADFGKLKPVISEIQKVADVELKIFVTGMHLLPENGSTFLEVEREFPGLSVRVRGQGYDESQLTGLSNLLLSLEHSEDFGALNVLIVHGDRLDALAATVAAKLNDTTVVHIEGGELSGSIDERIRHSITKFADWHLVANQTAANRLSRMGEEATRIIITGSPEASVILSPDRPSLPMVQKRYSLTNQPYVLLAFHPVVDGSNENELLKNLIIDVVKHIHHQIIAIECNNDDGHDQIREALETCSEYPNFRSFTSIRFEYYLTLLENAEYVIGNSSSFVREAPLFGVPSIAIGSRQQDRTSAPSVLNLPPALDKVIEAIQKIDDYRERSDYFGNANAASNIINELVKIFTSVREGGKNSKRFCE